MNWIFSIFHFVRILCIAKEFFCEGCVVGILLFECEIRGEMKGSFISFDSFVPVLVVDEACEVFPEFGLE